MKMSLQLAVHFISKDALKMLTILLLLIEIHVKIIKLLLIKRNTYSD